MNKKKLREIVCRVGFLIDQMGFPVFISYFVVARSCRAAQLYPQARESLSRILVHPGSISDGIIFSRFMSEALFVLFNAVTLWALIIRRKPYKTSETIREVVVPLFTLTTYLSINLISEIPASINPRIIPDAVLLGCSLIGSILIFLGLAVSLVAIFQLRRSFAVLVQVRDVVSNGLYRYMRHPIYLGYFVQMAGILLAVPFLWTILWALSSGALFIYRAKLEETRIVATFPEYSTYRERTPFLFPFKRIR